MFEGCTGLSGTIDLTQFTDIQGTGNNYGAFDYAFVGCTGITKIDLSSLTTAHGIYHEFDGCTSLQELDLSNLETIRSDSQSVFENMCNGCTSLTTVKLNKLASMGSYNTQWHNTFKGCSSLENVFIDQTQTIPYFYNNATFYGANANYRIVVPDALYDQWIVTSGWSEQGVVEHIMGSTEAETLTFTAAQAGSTVAMNAVGAAPSISLEYSTDHGDTWNDFTVGSTTITLDNVGDKVNIRAKTPNSVMATGENVRNTFSITGEVTASGNLAAILNKDVEQGKLLDSTANQHLRGLFRGCSNLVGSAKNLVIPFETLYNDSLDQTFRESGIAEAPELQFTTSGNASCFQTFYGCRSLVSPPSTLRPEEIGLNTYRAMFQNCTSLTSSPVVNATTSGQQSFMDMFNGCSSLENAPDILVSTLIGREPARYMFQRSGIRKLVFPNLVQIGSGSSGYAYPLGQMCYNCPQLEEVYMPNLTTVSNNQTAYDMFNNCPSLKLVDWRNLSIVESNTNNLGACFYRTPSLQILDLHLSQGPFTLTTGTTTFRGTNPQVRILVPTG